MPPHRTVLVGNSPNFLEPNPLLRRVPYIAAGFVFVFALALFSVSTLVPTATEAAAPTFSGGTPNADAGGVAANTAVTSIASEALKPRSLSGQWATVTQSPATSAQFNGVHMVSRSVGYAAGASGTLYTYDGSTWTAQTSGTSNNLLDVHCVDASTCWAVGASGTARKTSNGGTTWSAVTMPGGETSQFNAVYVASATTILIGTGDNEILATTDGGATWATDTTTANAAVNDIEFSDANTGYLATSSGNVYKTTNGAGSWAAQAASGNALTGLAVVDANTVVAVGASGTIVRTTNGGTAWTAQTSGTSDAIAQVHCTAAATCWAVTLPSNPANPGVALDTTDSGTTWNATSVAGTAGFTGIHGAGRPSMVLTGRGGVILALGSNVRLQANSGNTSTGSPSGANFCTDVTLSGGDRTVTCAHDALSDGTWYTLVLVGTTNGIESATNDVLAAHATKSFRTAFATGASATIASTSIAQLATEGYLSLPGVETAANASQATALAQLQLTLAVTDGTVQITIPRDAVLTPGDGAFNLNNFTLANADTEVTNTRAFAEGAIQVGVPSESIASSTAVTVSIALPAQYNGETLEVYRATTANFSGNTTPLTTCTVASGLCTFTTTTFSYFAVIVYGAPTSGGDATSPAAPTNTRVKSLDPAEVTFTWSDPPDADFDRVRILVKIGPATLLVGSAKKGVQKFVYSGPFLIPGASYIIGFQSVDTSGNRSNVIEKFAMLPLEPIASDTTPPTAPAQVAARRAADGVTFTWKDPVDPNLLEVEIYRLEGDEPVLRGFARPGAETFTDVDAFTPGRTYYYSILGVDLGANLSPIVPIVVRIAADGSLAEGKDVVQPEQPGEEDGAHPLDRDGAFAEPKIVAAASVDGAVLIAWKNPSGAALRGTEVYQLHDAGPVLRATLAPNVETFADTGEDLIVGTSYHYALQAVDDRGRRSAVARVGMIVRQSEAANPFPAGVPEEVVDVLADAPCLLSMRDRAHLAEKFRASQRRPPTGSPRDLELLCALKIDPRETVDIGRAFPEYRNLEAEEVAQANFVNFTKRLPGRDFDNRPLPNHIAAKDWLAIQIMAYHLLIAPTARNFVAERDCLRQFTDRILTLTLAGIRTTKPAGAPPQDPEHFAIIRACSYSGVPLVAAQPEAP